MTIAYLNSTVAADGYDGSTTSPIDTTGASLIVVAVTFRSSKTPIPLVDSEGNTWTQIHYQADGAFALEWWYSIAPTTSATHTFSHLGPFYYSSVAVSCYTGYSITLDQKSIAVVGGTSASPGSLTPVYDGSLSVTAYGANKAGAPTVDALFTLRQSVVTASGSNYTTAIADSIQVISAAINPIWSAPVSGNQVVAQIIFYEIPPLIRPPLVIDDGVIQQIHTPDYLEGYTTNAANLTPDNAIVRADGGVNGVQASTALIADTGALTLVQDATLETSGAHTGVFSIEDSAGNIAFEIPAFVTSAGNTGLGLNVLGVITTGTYNVGIGQNAGAALQDGQYNMLIGVDVGESITSGNSNVGIGRRSLWQLTTGSANVGLGTSALNSVVTGGSNIGIGFGALLATTSSDNAAFGNNAGRTLTTGSKNVFIGDDAGFHASQSLNAVGSVAIGAGTYVTKSGQVVIGRSLVTETLLQGNIAIDNALVSPNWQSMDSGFFMRDVTTAPAGNPTGGGFLYVEAGALKFRGSGGTVTTIAPA